MAIKGTTKIELTNVHTGEKEVVEHHNMITNVLSDMNRRVYGVNGMDTFLYMYTKQFLVANDPFWKAMFSGIILFEDALSDNADEYIFPAGNKVTGCGDIERVKTQDMTNPSCSVVGNFNSEESVLKDNMVKMVYDFPTSQGNGTISSIALCNKLLARSCYTYGSNCDTANLLQTSDSQKYTHTKNAMIASISNDGTTYTVSYYYYETDNLKIKLSSRINYGALLLTEQKTVSVDLGASDYTFVFTLPDSNTAVMYSSTQGKYKYVSITDGTVYDKSVPSGYDTVYPFDGYFVAIKSADAKYYYSILRADGTVLHENVLIHASLLQFATGMLDNRYVLGYIGKDYFALFDVNTGGVTFLYSNVNNISGLNGYTVHDKILHISKSDSWTRYFGFTTWQPWLTTKNNLNTPVTKTADKTMKVTYTLTEA